MASCIEGVIIVSYVPLLRGHPGELLSAERAEELVATGAGHVEAVLWTLEADGEFVPILALTRGDEIFEHLVEWSEGSPASWFHVEFDEDGDRYALAIVPDAERSIERFMLARALVTGTETPVQRAEVVMVFEPLLFQGPLSDASRRALAGLGDAVSVGIVDVDSLGDRAAPSLPESPSKIGLLRCRRRTGILDVRSPTGARAP